MRPVRVVVEAIRLTIVSSEVSGLPRQLRLMKLKRRCSIWGEMRRKLEEFGHAVAGRGSTSTLRRWQARIYAVGLAVGVRVTVYPSRSSWLTRRRV